MDSDEKSSYSLFIFELHKIRYVASEHSLAVYYCYQEDLLVTLYFDRAL